MKFQFIQETLKEQSRIQVHYRSWSLLEVFLLSTVPMNVFTWNVTTLLSYVQSVTVCLRQTLLFLFYCRAITYLFALVSSAADLKAECLRTFLTEPLW